MNILKCWLVNLIDAVRCSALFGDPTRREPTPVYTLDITESPIWPPNIDVWDGGLWAGETDLSHRRTAAWERYIKEYGDALNRVK